MKQREAPIERSEALQTMKDGAAMKITARPLTLGLALTLPLMGASALATSSITPDVVLASSGQTQGKPDPNGGHTGFHAKGCHGKFAQARASASGVTAKYHYYP